MLALAFSPDNQRLVTGSADSTVKIFDVASASEVAVLKGHQSAVLALVWHPDGKVLATATAHGHVKLWDVDPASASFATELDDVRAHDKEATCLAFQSNGSRLITCGLDGSIKSWALAGNKFGKEPMVVKWGSPILCLVAHEKLLATGHEDGKIRLLDPITGRTPNMETPVLIGHTGRVTSLSYVFLAGDPLLISTSADRSIKVWDMQTGIDYYTQHAHASVVTGVGTYGGFPFTFATSSFDKTVKLWALTHFLEKQPVLVERFTLPGEVGPVRAVAFSSFGHTLAGGGEDGYVRVWRAAAEER